MTRDPDNLDAPAADLLAADLTDAATLAETLSNPFDDLLDFDPVADPEVSMTAGLAECRTVVTTPTRRLFRDYRANPEAFRHIDPLPAEGETLHGVTCGRVAAWDLVPALIERTGQDIADLYIATLSYSKQNAAELLGLLDAGRVARVGLLVSYYFKAQNRGLYDLLVPPLRERGHRVLAMRTHAKLLLLRMVDGTCYVVEGSANLRSNKNLEQFCLTRCPDLYAFHRGWMDELFAGTTREEGDPDEAQDD